MWWLNALFALDWNWEPWILTSLALAIAGYVLGTQRIPAGVRSQLFGKERYLAFATGIAILFVFLITPLDALDDQLFSAHMAQHMVLMMVAPPLLIMGRPGLAFLWAFPLPARRKIGRLWAGGLRHSAHKILSPIVVWISCSAALWFWHLPIPYGWALASEPVHALEHICFFGTSLLFWSLVIEPLGKRRIDYGITMLFVLTLGVQNGLIGALLTFAGRPLYVAYLGTTTAWGLTPLEDQQLGGLGMWIPASLIHLTTLAVLFVAWLGKAEHRASTPSKSRLGTAAS